MLDKTVVAAVAGIVGLMVVVTLIGQGSRKQGVGPAPPAPSVPAPKPLSDADLLRKYDQLPEASRYKELIKDRRASALFMSRMSRRVKGDYDKLSASERYFADSMTYGHGRTSVQTEGRRTQDKTAKVAK